MFISKKNLTCLVASLIALSVSVSAYSEEDFKPYTYEGAWVEVTNASEDGNAGRVRLRSVFEYGCQNCGKDYTFDTNTKLMIKETKQYVDIRTLENYVDDIAQVSVQRPGYVRLFVVSQN